VPGRAGSRASWEPRSESWITGPAVTWRLAPARCGARARCPASRAP
jgi:hypothetical protein